MNVQNDRYARLRHIATGALASLAALAAVGTLAGTTALAASGHVAGRRGLSAVGGTTHSRSSSSRLLQFARCMRSHGVPNFPDPTNSEKFPGAQQLGVNRPLFQRALNTCKHLLPNGAGNASSPAALQREENALLPFARCMRSHGVSDWPDPSIYTNPDGETAVVFKLTGTSLDGNGFDSSRVQATSNACQHLLPPSHGGPPYLIVRSHR